MRRKTKRENIKIWKIFRAEEKEAIICRRKIFFVWIRKQLRRKRTSYFKNSIGLLRSKTEKEMEENILKRKMFCLKVTKNRERKGGKY